MTNILIIAEHNQTLSQTTQHVVTAAHKLGQSYDVLVVGEQCHAVVEEVKKLPQANKILVADHAVYAHQLAENTAALVAEIGKDYDYILTGATTFGKNILPRVAALLDVGMVGDVIAINSDDTFVRPIYAGNALATVKSKDKIKLLTIRTTSFPLAPLAENHAETITLKQEIANKSTRFESQSLTESKRPELTAAKIIISGGRGLKSAENFRLIEELADQLGAAVGASRAAVDAGFAPNDYQVGQTGKVVAPDLYIAIGISGAIQHLAGMKDSKVIVAINSDPDAPIFQIADYGLVGDLFKLLPELREELARVL